MHVTLITACKTACLFPLSLSSLYMSYITSMSEWNLVGIFFPLELKLGTLIVTDRETRS